VSPLHHGQKKQTREQLRERVRDAAVEAAQNAPQRAREFGEAAREFGDAAREAAREAAQNAPERVRELRQAASQLDLPWARSAPARWIRENFLTFILAPIMDYYMARRADGYERIATLEEPVILVANHSSHVDTPVILSALPRRLRKHTAVAAAADYFYKNKLIASIVSLLFGTVPLDRKGGGLSKGNGAHLDKLLEDGWNLLLYPEGSRREHGARRVRRGAAVLAAEHHMPIVPIRVTGTAEAMPPGQIWPKRLRGRLLTKRHRIQVSFGEPIPPQEDTAAMIELVQNFFDGEMPPSRSPYKRRPITGGQD